MPWNIKKKRSSYTTRTQPKGKRIIVRTFILACVIVIFTVGIFAASIIPYQKDRLLTEMKEMGKVSFTSIAQITAFSLILEDYSTVVDHCMALVEKNPSIIYVVLTRHDGTSLIHTKGKWSQKTLDGLWTPSNNRLSQKGWLTQSSLVNQEVFHCTFSFSYSAIDWGWIHIGLSPKKFYEDLATLYMRTFWIALLSISVGLVAAYIFAGNITRPIIQLNELTQRVGAGDLAARVDVSTGDEVESLANSFNRMTESLMSSRKELDEAHKRLVDAARNAGMAEVATGILHNVGNILNSVVVTTSAAKERIGQLKTESFARLAEQVNDHIDELPAFMAENDQGKKMSIYLTGLSGHMTQEKNKLMNQLDELTAHIQSISQIVDLQQSYSKKAGLFEPVDLIELVENALSMNTDSLTSKDIQFNCEFMPVLPPILDRNKVLHIILNLISNAKHALLESTQEHKLITIRVEQADAQFLRIVISDNGVGINKENITRIFSYGFTTKKNGHGFGLHSAALSAREMGGLLDVHSDGPGIGATFTLTLPLEPEKNGYDS